MKSAKTVAESLRDATHEVHRSLEKLPLAASLAAGSISIPSYRLYLQRLLVIVREIDLRLMDPRHVASGAREWSDGLRERWIGEDLAALGVAVPTADPGTSGEALAAPAIWGQLYVIEGSTLGGVVLARGLAAREELRPALRYLNGYGTGTGERWRRFRAALAEHVPAAGLPEAIDAAHDMFSRFGREVMA